MPMPSYDPADDAVSPGVPVAPNAAWVARRKAVLTRLRAARPAGLPMGRGDGAGDPPDAISPADANTLAKAGLARVEKDPVTGKYVVTATA